jgi:hypothetical protein
MWEPVSKVTAYLDLVPVFWWRWRAEHLEMDIGCTWSAFRLLSAFRGIHFISSVVG